MKKNLLALSLVAMAAFSSCAVVSTPIGAGALYTSVNHV